ncbi:MAG: fused MFS/spermidine synthase [Bryobacteraceae bacterium]|nr:fused MFS/spermidine synthase [Bryobacteraceae bacterium]MDW8377067.1 fused MFS/spermidine synthase [Bryobacterales bacterium]
MLLYAATIFLSAFLLFQLQPMIARMILPWFGGSAAVWTTCMLFFQTVLLLGYLYVHWFVKRWPARRHALMHSALLAVSLALLPITPSPFWKPEAGGNPSLQILALLAACVGLPYFLLSTTSPLLQSWYSRSGQGVLPYRLFALSNFGSLLALITYPVVVEPYLSTRLQGLVWSGAYAVFVILCLWTARVSTLRGQRVLLAETPESKEPPPSRKTQLLWIALAACPSALMLSITNHLTQDVAAMPFLWVVPLTIYLLSFILCFDADGWYQRPIYLGLLWPALFSMAYLLHKGTEDIRMKILLLVFSAAFFICCMFCHGELVKRKPHPQYLTSFYLMLSVGGAAGGLLVGLIAPYLFVSYFEFPLSLFGCGALAIVVVVTDPASRFFRDYSAWTVILMTAALAGLATLCVRTQYRNLKDYKVVRRNFYGTLRVRETKGATEWDSYRTLLHGAINHGENWIHPERQRELLTYYCPDSGVGRAIRTRRPQTPQKIGVFGLGAGSIAGYGRPGDVIKFYEINPLVVELARQEFFYLRATRAKVEIVLGDARLSLEKERPNHFDVLAVDCFSGDSIPVHLLTREAVELYLRHLKPEGILALHVSNRFLELEPVVEKIASRLKLAHLQVESAEDDQGNCFESTWILLARDQALLEQDPIRGSGSPIAWKPSVRLWTDDYSSLFGVLK